MIHPRNCCPAAPSPVGFNLSNLFSFLWVSVCKSCHSFRSGSFGFEVLVGMCTLHPLKLLLLPPCLFQSLDYFWKPPPPVILCKSALLSTVDFRNSTHCHHPPVKRRCRDSEGLPWRQADGSAEQSYCHHRITAAKNPKSGTWRSSRDSQPAQWLAMTALPWLAVAAQLELAVAGTSHCCCIGSSL